MGTTANSVHVRLDGSSAQAAVADVVGPGTLVSPPRDGWVSVYPADPMSCEELAADLSAATGAPCIGFQCFDSDVALAVLTVQGYIVDTITAAYAGLFEEMTGAPPDAPALIDDDDRIDLFGQLDVWCATLGTGSVDAIRAELDVDPTTPFAEQVACAAMDQFGIAGDRLLMAHRFFEAGEEPELRATFVAT